MITSSTDIYKALVGDALINAIAKIRIAENGPSLAPEDGAVIYISKYPVTSEFEAYWSLWIIDFDNEPLDVVVGQIRRIFPRFQVLEDGAIISGRLTELKTTRTETVPPAPQKISIEPYLATLDERFNELRESIQDQMLLVSSGRPGKDGSDGSPGRDGRNGRDGKDLVATEAELGDLQDVYVEDAKKDQVLIYDGDSWVARYVEQHYGGGGGLTQSEIDVLQGIKETGEPMGFADRTDSTISFDDSSRIITIAPVDENFVVWVKGKRFVIEEPASIQIPDITGLYFIFFDVNGDIGYQTDYFYWDSEAPAAYIYWDADLNTAPYVADERHGIVLDWQTHEYLHRTRGASFANGFSILNFVIDGDNTLDSSAQFDLNGGTFFDEDLQIDITHSETPNPALFQQDLQGPAKCPVFYKVGTTWKLDAANNFAFKMAATRPYYNSLSSGVWAVTEASNNRFVNYYIVATHNLRAPVISLMGQHEYVNISDAQIEDFGSLNLNGFPSKEFRFLYKIILRTGNYTNSVDCVIAGIQDLRTYSDQFVAALDVGSIRIDQLDAPIGSVSFNNQKLVDLGAPTGLTDATNKQYVDGQVQTLSTSVSTNFCGINDPRLSDTRTPTDGSVTTAKIGDDQVTYSKIQNVSATDRILGRSTAGAGNIEEIVCTAAGRALLDDTDAASQRSTLGLGSLATQSGTFSGTSSGTNTGDQTISLTGDATGSGTAAITLTLANSGATAGTYNNSATAVTPITIDVKGRVTATGAAVTVTPAWSSITSKPTTLSGFGITDAASSTHVHGNITNAGAIGSTANLPIITTTSGLLTTGSFGTTANTFCQGNDSRLSDARNTVNSVTFNNAGAGGASGSTFNGGSALTVSYNTVGAPSTTGANASGIWGVSISGNSATTSGCTFPNDSSNKEDITTRTDSGFYESGTGTTAEGWPLNNSSWQHLIACTHSNDANYYSMQIAAGFYSQNWYFRNTNGSGTTAWSTMLHSGNYTSYSPSLTGTGASGTWGISVSGSSASCTGNSATATNATSAGNITGGNLTGDYQVTSGVGIRFGHGSQTDTNDGFISAGRFASGLNIVGTQTTAGTGRQVRIWGSLIDSSGTSYVQNSGTWAINITGNAGTATTASNVAASADQAIVNQHNGNGAAWYGRILSKNSTSNKAAFLGTYASIAGVFSHNNALNAWDDLYVNTVDGASGGTVRMPSSVLINGSQALHAGNYTSYSPSLTGSGASGMWGINISGSALNLSNTGTVTLATATEANAITITAPSYTTDQPVKLLNFDWYGNMFSLGNIRSGSTPTNGFGVYYTASGGSRGEIARFSTGGNFTAVGNVTAYSDRRLKTNIETIKNALPKVQQLRGVTYERIDQPEVGRQIGVIAQEVAEIIPEVVCAQSSFDPETGESQEKLTVAYGNLVGLLIEAVKELSARVEELESNRNDA